MDIKEWIKATDPDTYARFLAWKLVGFKLKPGQWVRTLFAGFSGPPGRECQYLGTETWDNTAFGNFGYVGQDPRWGMKKSEYFQRLIPISDPGV